MNFFDSLRISSSGLSAQRLRMNLISGNLANVNTTRTPEGGPFQRKEAVFESQPINPDFQELVESELDARVSQVKVAGVSDDQRPPVVKFDPNHPDADEKGYVSFPNINVIEEMVDMMTAARSYEANVTAITTAKTMANKALEIGKR